MHSEVVLNHAHIQLTLGEAIELEAQPADELSSTDLGAQTLEGDVADTVDDDEIILDVEISGASVSTTKSWDGTHESTFVAGEVTEHVNAPQVEVATFHEEFAGEVEDLSLIHI